MVIIVIILVVRRQRRRARCNTVCSHTLHGIIIQNCFIVVVITCIFSVRLMTLRWLHARFVGTVLAYGKVLGVILQVCLCWEYCDMLLEKVGKWNFSWVITVVCVWWKRWANLLECVVWIFWFFLWRNTFAVYLATMSYFVFHIPAEIAKSYIIIHYINNDE